MSVEDPQMARVVRTAGEFEVGPDLQRRTNTAPDLSREEKAMQRVTWVGTIGVISTCIVLTHHVSALLPRAWTASSRRWGAWGAAVSIVRA